MAQGYEKLAGFLAANRRGIESYRAFGRLQSLNLLYLQAQLTDHEAQLRATIAEDAQSPDIRRHDLVYSWPRILASKDVPGLDLHYRLVMEIRSTLAEYRIVVPPPSQNHG